VLIVYGVYRWKPKPVAFRNDYCLSCGEARRAVQIRTFNAGHIFWIPILPVGFWKRWVCTTRGHDPHVSTKTRRGFKWVGLFILLIFSAVFWFVPVEPDSVALIWALRVATPVGAVLTLVHLFRTEKEPSLQSKLATVQPAADTVCPFCGAPLLVVSARCSCPGCGAVRN
jgi:hypothetical protein